MKRDEFTETVKRDLCDRVGGMCSRPDCRVFTKGPRASSAKAKNIGRASHIHAAAPGGPRYDPQQTRDQRRSFANGIWLCANHASEVDDDDATFTVEVLRRWKADAEAFAASLVGRSLLASGPAASSGLVAIGPDVICVGRLVGSSSCIWRIAIDRFVLGDVGVLRQYIDSFGLLPLEDCFVCVEAEGLGRVLTEGPNLDLSSGMLVELNVAAPIPVAEARKRFDARALGPDIPIDLSGDEPDLDLSGREVSGIDSIPQRLLVHLSVCKGGHKVGAEAGSRVAEWRARLGADLTASFVALETIRLASIPHEDRLMGQTYVLLPFIERVRGVRLLETGSTEYIKAGITLDVHGVAGAREYVVPISTSTDELGPPPSLPSAYLHPFGN